MIALNSLLTNATPFGVGSYTGEASPRLAGGFVQWQFAAFGHHTEAFILPRIAVASGNGRATSPRMERLQNDGR